MSQSNASTKPGSPPKVRLTFRVGVVGHRPDRLRREDVSSLARRLGEVLSSVKKAVEGFSATHSDLYDKEAPCLRAISPLAEGTDRYFAREALKLDYELCCPFPFHKEEFENDFKPPRSWEPNIDSVADFNGILADAESKSGVTIFALDGVRKEETQAYAASARVVLNQSDLLIAVWDGDGENERGGTYETLTVAIKFSVPVLWIDARAPHPWQLLHVESDLPTSVDDKRCVPKSSAGLEVKIDEIVRHVLKPPEPPRPQDQHDKPRLDLRTAYFGEQRYKRNFFFWWKLFRDFLGSFQIRVPSLQVRDFEEAGGADWPRDTPHEVERWVNNQLRPHYAWSDNLADFYADRYRSSFVLCYGLAALVVLLGLLAHFWFPIAFSILELVVLSWIVMLVLRGNRRRWHDRWMNYRLIAELVRQLRILAPLGGGRPFPRVAAHATFGDPAHSWMYWHLRAVDRAVGLPNARVTATYLRQCLDYMARILRDQIKFHTATATRAEQIEQRLHRWGLRLFIVTIMMVAFHLIHLVYVWLRDGHGTEVGVHSDFWVIFTAGLPAIGAALAAINNQGEFARVAKRSRAMAGRLKRDLKQLDNDDAPLSSGPLAEDALHVAQTMVDEVLDWRLIFLDHPLVPPA